MSPLLGPNTPLSTILRCLIALGQSKCLRPHVVLSTILCSNCSKIKFQCIAQLSVHICKELVVAQFQ